VDVTLEDIIVEIRALRVELAAQREAKRLAKRRATKRSSSVLAVTVGQIQPSLILQKLCRNGLLIMLKNMKKQ
jgi:hypothetical protein